MKKVAILMIITDDVEFSFSYILENLVWCTNIELNIYLHFNCITSLDDIKIIDELKKSNKINLITKVAHIKNISETNKKLPYSSIYNDLVKHVKEDILVFFPQDKIVPKNWLEDMLYQKEQVTNCIGIGIKNVRYKLQTIVLEENSNKKLESTTTPYFEVIEGKFTGVFCLNKNILDSVKGFSNEEDYFEFNNFYNKCFSNSLLKIIIAKKISCFNIKCK